MPPGIIFIKALQKLLQQVRQIEISSGTLSIMAASTRHNAEAQIDTYFNGMRSINAYAARLSETESCRLD